MVEVQLHFTVAAGSQSLQRKQVFSDEIIARIESRVLQWSPDAVAVALDEQRVFPFPSPGETGIPPRFESRSKYKNHVDRFRSGLGGP